MPSVFEQRYQQNQQVKKAPNGSPFEQRAQNLGIPEEPWWKDLARTALQIPSGIAQASTYPLDLLNILATREALDPEGIEGFRRAAERSGIPFDEEKYRQTAEDIHSNFPTQGNLERLAEEKFGIPLTAKTPLQKGLKLGGTAAGFTKGALGQKAVAGVTAPAVSKGLQELGVPEPLAELGGLGISGIAGAKAPKIDIGKAKKPSGLTIRQYEKLKKPTEISPGKIKKINEKVEDEFRHISDGIIQKSPSKETFSLLKSDPTFKQQSREAFKEVQSLAEEIPDKFSTNLVKKELVDRVLNKKGTGFLPSEYDKSHKNFIHNFLKETPSQEITASDLVTQYRKNNKALSEVFEPGQSFAYNRAKREALLDYNKSIASVLENKFPDSEFSNLFQSTNKKWAEIMDAEAIDKFMDKMFDGKIRFEKGKNFFDKEGMTLPFKRALGEEGFKNFEQLMKDLMSTEQASKMLKAAASKGFKDLAETGIAFVLHPNIGKAKFAYGLVKGGTRKLYEALLDKPQLAFTWDKGVKAFRKGDFAAAEKAFDKVKSEAKSIKPTEILSPKKETIKPTSRDTEILGKAERMEKPQPQQSTLPPIKELQFKELPKEKLTKSSETGNKLHSPIEKKQIEFNPEPKNSKETPVKAKKQPTIRPASKELVPSKQRKEKAKSSELLDLISEKYNIKRPDITSKGLKSQKKFILDKVNEALENPSKYEGSDVVSIHVPGDGNFNIKNNPTSLKKFYDRIEKKWPNNPVKTKTYKTYPVTTVKNKS